MFFMTDGLQMFWLYFYGFVNLWDNLCSSFQNYDLFIVYG